MKKFLNILTNILSVLAGSIYIGGFFIYVLTIYMAFLSYGFLGGTLALVFPFVSTVYMFIALWISSGFLNAFTVICLIYIGSMAIIWGLLFLLHLYNEKQNNTYIEISSNEPRKGNNKMGKTIVICLTIIACFGIACFAFSQKDVQKASTVEVGTILSDGEKEALEYISEKADDMGITVGEYIQAVKEYEAEQNAMYEYFEKVENGTNTKADDKRAELKGWLD